MVYQYIYGPAKSNGSPDEYHVLVADTDITARYTHSHTQRNRKRKEIIEKSMERRGQRGTKIRTGGVGEKCKRG